MTRKLTKAASQLPQAAPHLPVNSPIASPIGLNEAPDDAFELFLSPASSQHSPALTRESETSTMAVYRAFQQSRNEEIAAGSPGALNLEFDASEHTLLAELLAEEAVVPASIAPAALTPGTTEAAQVLRRMWISSPDLFGSLLRHYRQTHGMTDRDFAAKLKCMRGSISRWEASQSTPLMIDSLKRLAGLFFSPGTPQLRPEFDSYRQTNILPDVSHLVFADEATVDDHTKAMIKDLSARWHADRDLWARRLVRYRLQNGFSERDIALICGVDKSAVCKWESGRMGAPGRHSFIHLLPYFYDLTTGQLLPSTEAELPPNEVDRKIKKRQRSALGFDVEAP